MNEPTPFFQSWGFWLCLGLVIGAVVGFFAHALCAISGQASRDEERWESGIIMSEITDIMNKPTKQAPITKGKPDKE